MRPLKITLALAVIALGLSTCSKKDSNPTTVSPTLPGCASVVAPVSGSFVTSTSVSFSWNNVSTASAYDLYVGTSASSAALVASNISATSYTYTIPTTPNITYYWYALPKNTSGSATGCTSTSGNFTYINITAPAPFGYYVVGYLPSYRAIADIPDVKFRMTNIVVYSFYTVNSSSGLSAPTSPSSTLAAVATKTKANNGKIFLGINDGSGDGKSYFKAMASAASSRNAFVRQVMNVVRQENLDGVDIDWEYPSTSDGSDLNFTLLMKELSDSLHRDAKYYLSCAITPGKYAGSIRDAIRNEVFAYADIFNVMAYDDFSTSVAYKHHSDYALAQTCLNYWLTTRGMPASKCVLGLPAYGRPSGITQSNTILTYKSILSQGGSPLSDSAVVTAGGFTNYTIYYNGQFTVKKKAKLAKDIANGVMLWEKWQDAADGNSLLKAACDTVGRAY